MPIRALIADDEASARSRLRKLLAPYPFELIEGDAHDGLAALEAIQKHRPQVVFLDIEMPGLGRVRGRARRSRRKPCRSSCS